MTPRQQKIMDLLSTGTPTGPAELRRESGLSLNALHRALAHLVETGDVVEVIVDGKTCYASGWARHRPAPALHSVWRCA